MSISPARRTSVIAKSSFSVSTSGAGYDHLAIDHATLKINQDNTISGGTDVTIIGGTLDLGGKTNTLGDVKLISGGILNGTLYAASCNVLSGNITATLAGPGPLTKTTSGQFSAEEIIASNVTVSACTLSATSLVCDSLTIGSASGNAAFSTPAGTGGTVLACAALNPFATETTAAVSPSTANDATVSAVEPISIAIVSILPPVHATVPQMRTTNLHSSLPQARKPVSPASDAVQPKISGNHLVNHPPENRPNESNDTFAGWKPGRTDSLGKSQKPAHYRS